MRWVFVVVVIVLIFGCGKTGPEKIIEKSPQSALLAKAELESVICSSAEKGQSCDLKLAKLGVVTKEQCCSSYKMCCR